MVSSNCTAYLQSLDIGVNKSFKSHLSNKIEEYIENTSNYNANGKLKKMDIDTMTSWIKFAADLVSKDTVLNACRAGGIPNNMDDFDVNTTYIATHERLGEQFLVKYDECLAQVSMDEFLKRETQHEEDENFEINLGNDYVVEKSDRQLRRNENTEQAIYKQQSQERAAEYLEDADIEDIADYSCC